MKMRIGLSFVFCFAYSIALVHADETPDRAVQFNRDVRSILSDACFACHGPDNGKRKADLRLDTEAGLNSAREAGVLPAKSGAASELIERITSDDPNVQMPPPGSGRKLTHKQIDVLKRWVKQGAPWQKHWAYIVPKRPSVPEGANYRRVQSPIDRFVLKRLREEGLKPGEAADRATLIRRLSLDLVGLPPTPQEVESFIEDQSSNAYEKVVDRLLKSKHHGER